eukprot:110020-Pleurochrysis_carterae.AAC.4
MVQLHMLLGLLAGVFRCAHGLLAVPSVYSRRTQSTQRGANVAAAEGMLILSTHKTLHHHGAMRATVMSEAKGQVAGPSQLSAMLNSVGIDKLNSLQRAALPPALRREDVLILPSAADPMLQRMCACDFDRAVFLMPRCGQDAVLCHPVGGRSGGRGLAARRRAALFHRSQPDARAVCAGVPRACHGIRVLLHFSRASRVQADVLGAVCVYER